MKKLQCACGHEVEGENNDQVEAKMWHHAVKDHEDMLKNMSVDEMTNVIADQHSKLASQ